jgi:hypothetical protein
MIERGRLSPSVERVAIVIAALIVATSSFDIFLVLQAGGNYRFCQLLTPLLAILAALRVKSATMLPTLGGLPLSIWFLVQVLFVPVSDFWPKSVGYCLWLLLNMAVIWCFVQLFSHDVTIIAKLLRVYAYSFGAAAAFGILQFILPLVGFDPPLVTQWWIPGSVARANGFSYEPSYFATYLLIGFVFIASLRRAHSSLLPRKVVNVLYCLTALGILVSSSRMGLVFLFLDMMLAQIEIWVYSWRDISKGRMSIGSLKNLAGSAMAMTLLLAVPFGAIQMLEARPAAALVVLNGTGLSNTAAHSVIQREDAFGDTLEVFFNHPLVGQSLGGVSSAIAGLHGDIVNSFEESKDFEGMNVFAEALAASGIIGIIPFAIFVGVTIVKPLQLARSSNPFYSSLLHALVRALVFAWLILQFNQNMLRPYLWLHLAILATVYAAAQRAPNALR